MPARNTLATGRAIVRGVARLGFISRIGRGNPAELVTLFQPRARCIQGVFIGALVVA